MKRGLIMKVSRRKAVILTKDGSFEQVRLKKGEQPEVGQEYICPADEVKTALRPNRVFLPSFSLALVAIIVFVLFAGGLPFGHQKASAAAYVSFDINPSIEVAVDEDMNIVKVRALNEDAKKLLEGTDGYEDASLLYFSQDLFGLLQEYGYFDKFDDLLIASSYKESSVSPELRKRLQGEIEQFKSFEHIQNTNIVISIMEATPDSRKKANELGLSMGKFLVYQDAAENNDSLELEDLRNFSIKEVRNLSAEISSQDPDTKESALPKVNIDDSQDETSQPPQTQKEDVKEPSMPKLKDQADTTPKKETSEISPPKKEETEDDREQEDQEEGGEDHDESEDQEERHEDEDDAEEQNEKEDDDEQKRNVSSKKPNAAAQKKDDHEDLQVKIKIHIKDLSDLKDGLDDENGKHLRIYITDIDKAK
ncbi:anti-sigma factor domain-containing protein [Pseudalkalibacillus sp. SCS-8]|uniref:anti-sigma-I factor RsgI family protein n=1 Tax=Pseudalkalibacillus nanhaiensis TaxID=3115291 RepID=UPI0032DAD05D